MARYVTRLPRQRTLNSALNDRCFVTARSNLTHRTGADHASPSLRVTRPTLTFDLGEQAVGNRVGGTDEDSSYRGRDNRNGDDSVRRDRYIRQGFNRLTASGLDVR